MNRRVTQKKKYDITAKQIYTKNKQINLSLVKQMLSEGSLIQLKEMIHIVKQFQNLIQNQPNVVKVNDPVIIVGDIHGQYFDLVKILALFGQQKIESKKSINPNAKETTFVFLGDYVDRGIMAIQVISILMLLKLSNPKTCVMLRGNHESRIMGQLYNFKLQCVQKYSQDLFQIFMQCFDSLPIACVVNDKYFCVHGGISDKLKLISQINKIDRNIEIPLNGPFCDYIWSDPTPVTSGRLKVMAEFNDSRECSIYFGAELAEQFLKDNKLQTIIRGHQVFQQGFKSYNWLKREVPMAITIFSAPNYCNTYGNKGAVMRIQNDKVKIRQYNQQLVQNYRFIEQPQLFKWTIDRIIQTTNIFSHCMINRICQLYIPQLLDQKSEKQLEAFQLYYEDYTKNGRRSQKQKKYQKVQPQKKKFSILEIEKEDKQKPFANQQEQKDYLFSRSQQYFKQSQKIPKKNKFRGGNGRTIS